MVDVNDFPLPMFKFNEGADGDIIYIKGQFHCQGPSWR